jgi:hypothetical protein
MCKTCGEENADRNAAFNIAYRALGYISKVGVTVNIPVTLASTDRSTMMTRETRKRLPVYLCAFSAISAISTSDTGCIGTPRSLYEADVVG